MPEPIAYLLFTFGVVLVIGGFAKPRKSTVKTTDLRIETRLRLGIHQYRRAGLILGTMIIGLGWYGSSSPSLPYSGPLEHVAPSPTAVGNTDHFIFESDFIEIELPGGWTSTDVFGLEIPDLDSSELPRAVQISIATIPIKDEELHLFAFDKDYQATLVILASGIDSATISVQLDRRWALYTWIGVPVAETQDGLMISGMDAGTLVLDPIHRYQLFREKQFLITTNEQRTFILIFSTLADFYREREPIFSDIASSFRVHFEP